eukprot:1701849-Pyramimonas_sp.AAC.1
MTRCFPDGEKDYEKGQGRRRPRSQSRALESRLLNAEDSNVGGVQRDPCSWRATSGRVVGYPHQCAA